MRGSKNRSLTAVAYSSGTSSAVALLISSREHKIYWDFVLKSVADMALYSKFSKKDKKLLDQAIQFMSLFKLVAGKDCDEIAKDEDSFNDRNTDPTDIRLHHLVLLEQGVISLTIAQLRNAWWLLWALAMTSSAVDKLVVAAAPYITHDHPMRDYFETVLRFTGQVQLLPDYAEDNASGVGSDIDSVIQIDDAMVDELFSDSSCSNKSESNESELDSISNESDLASVSVSTSNDDDGSDPA